MADFTIAVGVDSVRCASCGTVFGMSAHHKAKRIDDGQIFYCPNGHTQSFTPTEADRLRKIVAGLEQRISALVLALESAEEMRSKIEQRHKRLLAARKR